MKDIAVEDRIILRMQDIVFAQIQSNLSKSNHFCPNLTSILPKSNQICLNLINFAQQIFAKGCDFLHPQLLRHRMKP